MKEMTPLEIWMAVEANVKERLQEGDGFWRSCSGCYETEDGQNVHGYPHSKVFGCELGSGCSECGGIGAVWDTVDYGAMADDIAKDMDHPAQGSRPSEAPGWLWYGDVDGKPVVTFGRWPKHGAQWRYKWADIQPTEHDHAAPPAPHAAQVETAFLNLCEALGIAATAAAYLDAKSARAALQPEAPAPGVDARLRSSGPAEKSDSGTWTAGIDAMRSYPFQDTQWHLHAIEFHHKVREEAEALRDRWLATATRHCGQKKSDRPAAFLAWAVEMFGPVAKLRSERLMRFIEEAIELAHADEMERATLEAITNRVYSRPPGEITKEIGQAQACLETYAENIGECSDLLTEIEWRRVRNIPRSEWERRHKAKQELGIAEPSSVQSPGGMEGER